MPMRWAVLTLSLCAVACGGGSGKALSAAITAGAAVAGAGVYRAATDGCWAACANGELCDEESGMCVPAPCNGSCRADYDCMWVDGQQQCNLPTQEGGRHVVPVDTPGQTDKETNHALCLLAGITDCPDRPHQEQVPTDDEQAKGDNDAW